MWISKRREACKSNFPFIAGKQTNARTIVHATARFVGKPCVIPEVGNGEIAQRIPATLHVLGHLRAM